MNFQSLRTILALGTCWSEIRSTYMPTRRMQHTSYIRESGISIREQVSERDDCTLGIMRDPRENQARN